MAVRGKQVQITCKCGCGRKKMVREADRKRGWGLYFDKSCKAKAQERRTGQYADYKNRQSMDRGEYCGPVSMEAGMMGHGQWE